jgi:hypothetical protein
MRRAARALTLALALGGAACPSDGTPEADGGGATKADGGRAGDRPAEAPGGDAATADGPAGATPTPMPADAGAPTGEADAASPGGPAARDGAPGDAGSAPAADARPTAADAQVAAPIAAPIGEWAYVNATYFEKKDDPIVASVSGSLSIKADGTWSHSRYIGQIGAFGAGRYTVRGDVVTLAHDDGKSEDLVYKFFVGEHARGGVTMKALTLSFTDDSFVYLLIEKKK